MVMFPIAASETLGMKGMEKVNQKFEHIITFPTLEHCQVRNDLNKTKSIWKARLPLTVI